MKIGQIQLKTHISSINNKLLLTQVLQDCGVWAEFKVGFVSLSLVLNRKFWLI